VLLNARLPDVCASWTLAIGHNKKSKRKETNMLRKTLALAVAGLLGLSASVMAIPVPYGSPGTVNPATYTFTATGTGPITAYFVGQSAGYGSVIGLSVNGAAPLVYGLQNHTPSPNPAYGTPFIMGNVNAGDILRFVLAVDTRNGLGPLNPIGGSDVSYYLNSDASLNPGGDHHIYSYAYGGDIIIPAGTYIGFEDISPLSAPVNDLDYNDHQFVFTGVTGVASVPDGGMTLTMLGMAVAGLGLLRRKL
jgi:hypothetical protein